jgi:adenosylhomocysteine nucleosidase
MKIGMIVAMDRELEQLRPLFPEDKVILQKSGIATVNAAIQAVEMIRQYKPDCIISSGCAGGNGDDVNIQDVVVSTELVYHDVYCGTAIGHSIYGQVQGLPPRFPADPYLLQKAQQLSIVNSQLSIVNCQFSIHPGLIVTGDWFVDTKEKMREIVGHFPEAKAVDMESCAIAQVCYIYKVPFISFRVISDIPLRDTDASQYHDFWNTIAQNSFHVTRTFIESL